MPLTLVFEHAGAVTLEVPVEGVMAGREPGHDGSTDHGEQSGLRAGRPDDPLQTDNTDLMTLPWFPSE